jgi:hypothetical protein
MAICVRNIWVARQHLIQNIKDRFEKWSPMDGKHERKIWWVSGYFHILIDCLLFRKIVNATEKHLIPWWVVVTKRGGLQRPLNGITWEKHKVSTYNSCNSDQEKVTWICLRWHLTELSYRTFKMPGSQPKKC